MSDAVLLQPHNLEAEESVLGAMMVSASALDPVIVDVRLSRDDFYRGRHGEIYAAIVALYERGAAVDALTVSEELDRRGVMPQVGGRDTITSLASSTPVPGNAGHHAAIVREHGDRRRALGFAGRLQSRIHSGEIDSEGIRELIEREALELIERTDGRASELLTPLVAEAVIRLEKRMNEGVQEGIPFGFEALDDKLGGLHPGRLTVIAARPGVGKSALATGVVDAVGIRQRKPTLFISLEMSKNELTDRMLVARSRISTDRFAAGDLQGRDLTKIMRAANAVDGAPVHLDDNGYHTLASIRSLARSLHARHHHEGGLALVVVDYLQLISPPASRPRESNRTNEVSEIARGLKLLARELEVPVLALSQLNRGVETRADGIPTLADLRESGEIEQAADAVILLSREEMRDPDTDRLGICDANVAKNRQGPTGSVELAWLGHYSSFQNLAREAA